MTGKQNREPVRQEMVLCCRKKAGCPKISVDEAGNFVLHDAEQTEPGRVVLEPEQAEMMAGWILQHPRFVELAAGMVLKAPEEPRAAE